MARNSRSVVPTSKNNVVARHGGSDFAWAGDDFADMARRQKDMRSGMDKMMSNFGMPSMKDMMMRDPFADDPFFNGGGQGLFGQMDSMMNDMRK